METLLLTEERKSVNKETEHHSWWFMFTLHQRADLHVQALPGSPAGWAVTEKTSQTTEANCWCRTHWHFCLQNGYLEKPSGPMTHQTNGCFLREFYTEPKGCLTHYIRCSFFVCSGYYSVGQPQAHNSSCPSPLQYWIPNIQQPLLTLSA